jgi:hypothetical protein
MKNRLRKFSVSSRINGGPKISLGFQLHNHTHDHLWSVRIDAINGVLLEKMIL